MSKNTDVLKNIVNSKLSTPAARKACSTLIDRAPSDEVAIRDVTNFLKGSNIFADYIKTVNTPAPVVEAISGSSPSAAASVLSALPDGYESIKLAVDDHSETIADHAVKILDTQNKLEDNDVTLKKHDDDISAIKQDDWVTTVRIKDAAVSGDKIAANAVTSDKLAKDLIIEGVIQDEAITSEKLATAAVTYTKIADSAVIQSKIATDAVTSDKIKAGAVVSAKLADNAVTSGKISDEAVTSGKLGAGAVVSAKLADNAVTSGKISDLSVTSGKLATDAVTSVKISDGAVVSAKLATDAVTSDKISDGAVVAAKLATDAITSAKLGAIADWVGSCPASIADCSFGGGALAICSANAGSSVTFPDMITLVGTCGTLCTTEAAVTACIADHFVYN